MRPTISRTRSRWRLRSLFPKQGSGNGRHRSAHGGEKPMAKPIRGTVDWKHSPRVSQSGDRARRAASEMGVAKVFPILPRLEDAFILREGRAEFPGRCNCRKRERLLRSLK